MRHEVTVDVAASAAAVWSVMAELSRWPEWTPTFEEVRAEPGEPRAGQQVRFKQPGRRWQSYVVDAVEPGRRFRWGSSNALVMQSADHLISPDGPDRCSVTLSFEMGGPLGRVLGPLVGGPIRRAVDTEAASLAARAARAARG